MPEDDPTTEPVSAGGGTSTVRLGDAAQLQPGQRIGHYKILEQIGEGGFAIVYLAEQEKPVRGGWRSRSSSWGWTPSR